MDSFKFTPNLAALAISTFSRYCGKLGLNPEVAPTMRGSSFSFSTNVLATSANSAKLPAVLSCKRSSKPLALPNPGTVGGRKN